MNKELFDSITSTLSKKNKFIKPKWFYDNNGSKLFSKICKTKEYYPTRTEIKILKEFSKEIAFEVGEKAMIFEPGAGDSEKIEIIIKSLQNIKTYIPSDISKIYLNTVSKKMKKKYPNLNIKPLAFDFTKNNSFVKEFKKRKKIVTFFPGSTIGNFTKFEAKSFLKKIKNYYNSKKLIVGVDLKKDKKILVKAYNGKITQIFNKNVLKRINNELHANFEISNFKHFARYNSKLSRIEMHLISKKKQEVLISKKKFYFKKGEKIHTENSYKYSVEEFKKLAKESGWISSKVWTDKNKLFSVHLLLC